MRQGKEYLFVDGYNIINAWPELIDKASENIESARQTLLDILIEYKHYVDIHVIIVFDAYKVKGTSLKKEKVGGVEVIYTKENETADAYIEKVLNEIGRSKKVSVASSDGMLQQLIMSRGGLRISAREFYHIVNDTKADIRRKNQKIADNRLNYRTTLDSETIKKLNQFAINQQLEEN